MDGSLHASRSIRFGAVYDSIIRVNSQSGKGGIAYLLDKTYGLSLPRRLQIEFGSVVQSRLDKIAKELEAKDLYEIFTQTYLNKFPYLSHTATESANGLALEIEKQDGSMLKGVGNGPISACIDALGKRIKVVSYEERSLSEGALAQSVRIC